MRTVLVLAVLLGGCGGGASGADAGRDAASCAVDPSLGLIDALGTIPTADGCVGCEEVSGDAACRGAYTVGAGCTAYCQDGLCWGHCEGECRYVPDAGGCTVGARACPQPGSEIGALWLCDPTCGAAGGCRMCITDEECAGELGDGAECQRHCGTCCNPGDGGVACSCI